MKKTIASTQVEEENGTEPAYTKPEIRHMKTAIGEHLLVTFFGVYEPREFILRSQLQEEMVMKKHGSVQEGPPNPKICDVLGRTGNPKSQNP